MPTDRRPETGPPVVRFITTRAVYCDSSFIATRPRRRRPSIRSNPGHSVSHRTARQPEQCVPQRKEPANLFATMNRARSILAMPAGEHARLETLTIRVRGDARNRIRARHPTKRLTKVRTKAAGRSDRIKN